METTHYLVVWKRHNGDIESEWIDDEHDAGEFYSQLRREGMPAATIWKVSRCA